MNEVTLNTDFFWAYQDCTKVLASLVVPARPNGEASISFSIIIEELILRETVPTSSLDISSKTINALKWGGSQYPRVSSVRSSDSNSDTSRKSDRSACPLSRKNLTPVCDIFLAGLRVRRIMILFTDQHDARAIVKLLSM